MECLLNKSSNLYLAIRCKTFHTSCFLNGWRQKGTVMRKIMGGTQKKKLYFDDAPKMLSPELFSKGSVEGKKSVDSRRAAALNKMFMYHITDQLASGQCAEEILGYGVEINRVKVAPDYKLLNVYWLAKGTKNDAVVEEILHKNAGLIRHELSQLRLMGVVPIIQFIKDKHYAHIAELDNRLAVADFGEDHVPLDPAEKLKTEFEICSPLGDSIKEKLKELDKVDIEEYEELPLPQMPQNVLGLNHGIILDRIKKLMKKSQAPHRSNTSKENDTWVTFKVNQTMNDDPVQLGDSHTQRETLKEFLHKRQLLRLKARQEYKNFIPDVEYIREELEQRHKEDLSKFDIPETCDEDIVNEDVEDDNDRFK